MAKIVFDDKSYVEIRKSEEPGKILLLIGARDYENPLKKITNCVEITQEELKALVEDVS
jgi:hypothetical protein